MTGDTERFGTMKPGSLAKPGSPPGGTGKKSEVIPKPTPKSVPAPPPPASWARLQGLVTDVCPQAEVGPEARWLFRDRMTVLAFLDVLTRKRLLEDAVCVLAAA